MENLEDENRLLELTTSLTQKERMINLLEERAKTLQKKIFDGKIESISFAS